jgi:hypothetical protein
MDDKWVGRWVGGWTDGTMVGKMEEWMGIPRIGHIGHDFPSASALICSLPQLVNFVVTLHNLAHETEGVE